MHPQAYAQRWTPTLMDVYAGTGAYVVLHTPTDQHACPVSICLTVDKCGQQRLSVAVIRVSLALSTAEALLI